MKKTLLLSLILVTSLLVSCKQQNIEDSDSLTIYGGGDIITMQGDLPEYAEALVEKDGEIVFVGSLTDAKAKAGEGYTYKDLKGKTLLPGFIDAHAHFSNFSSQAIGAQILPPPDAGANNIEALLDILKEWNTPENRALTGWIFGAGFDDSVLEDKRFPTKHDLDKVSTEFPIMIIHISGHFAVVNTKGLELLGITADTKDPEGGLIRRENGNEPNGVLEELAAIPNYAKALTPSSSEVADTFFRIWTKYGFVIWLYNCSRRKSNVGKPCILGK
jgi:hypothetical protein